MMDNNDLFTGLDEIINRSSTLQYLCCNDVNNYIISNDVINCKICNKTVSNIIDTPEWKSYTNDSMDYNRCGMPSNVLLPDSSHGSTINNRYNHNKSMSRVIQVQQWNGMSYKERSIYKVFNELIGFCNKSNLPLIIINESKSLYKIIAETKISRGQNRKGLIAACIYFSCKTCGHPRSSKEIADICNIKTNIMTKGIKNFQELIQISNNRDRISEARSINALDFIDRFCDTLNIHESDINEIKNIVKKASEIDIKSENTPPSIAAASIYLYFKNNKIELSKKKLASISKISEVTINKCYKLLNENITI
jgi:transcription initiation factor TFIIB